MNRMAVLSGLDSPVLRINVVVGVHVDKPEYAPLPWFAVDEGGGDA